MVVVIVETAVVVVSFEDSTGEVVVEVAVVEDKSMVEKSCGWSACRCQNTMDNDDDDEHDDKVDDYDNDDED